MTDNAPQKGIKETPMSTLKPHSTVATRMSGIREDWLHLTQEEVLEPDLGIVDPHHHLWDFPSHRYLLPDLLSDTGSGDKISGSYAVYWNAFKRLASGASAADKVALFRDTARGFYRLS
jgi:hypothetical protein